MLFAILETKLPFFTIYVCRHTVHVTTFILANVYPGKLIKSGFIVAVGFLQLSQKGDKICRSVHSKAIITD